MKSLYWKPQKISRRVLLGVGVMSILGWALVELCPSPDAHGLTKRQAANRSQELMQAIKQERLRRGIPIHATFDTNATGLVGSAMSVITSRPANLSSKQTSVNPNFAAVVVEMLGQAGVKPGDTVAVGWSGSFPALNVAVCAAIEAMELRPVIIASATSSQYGANDPEFMWVDMETALRQQGRIAFASSAVSIGGGADRGMGMSDEAIAAVKTAIHRNGLPQLVAARRQQAIDNRMELYQKLADGREIKAYINVGGGVASTGGERGKHLFKPGLNRRASHRALQVDSVMSRFARAGHPVIHLIEARELAERYALPVAPTTPPEVGVGRAFSNATYNRWLAGVVLLAIVLTLRSYLLSPLGYRVSKWVESRWKTRLPRLRVVSENVGGENGAAEPQLMV